MKVGVCSFIWRFRYGIAVSLALLCCGVSAYVTFFWPQIPECRAVLRATNHIEGRTIERVLLVSIMPDGAKRVTVLLNGTLFDNQKRYVIDRAITMNYRRQGEHYTLWVTKNVKKSQDSLVEDDLNRRLLLDGQQYHLRIDKIDAHHFLLIDNSSPIFVCVSAP